LNSIDLSVGVYLHPLGSIRNQRHWVLGSYTYPYVTLPFIASRLLFYSTAFYYVLFTHSLFLLSLIRGRYVSTARILAVINSDRLSYIGDFSPTD